MRTGSGGSPEWCRDDDLGAVGSVGAPSGSWWRAVVAFDAEAVVDLGVVPFAEQAEVVQVGRPVEHPLQDVMGVAPPVRGFAAGEDASSVAGVQGAALSGGDDPLGAAEVDRDAAGAEHD